MIVNAKFKHLSEIISIENQSFDDPWSFYQFEKDLEFNKTSGNWVYLINRKVVGYVFGLIILDEYHITNIAVHPKFLRQKIGTKLMQYIITYLLSNNISIILLEVSSNNISAQKYYKSIGFIAVGIRKKYYKNGDDAILYNLDLD